MEISIVSVKNVYNNGFITQLAIDTRLKQKFNIHSKLVLVGKLDLYTRNDQVGKRHNKNVAIRIKIALNIRTWRTSRRLFVAFGGGSGGDGCDDGCDGGCDGAAGGGSGGGGGGGVDIPSPAFGHILIDCDLLSTAIELVDGVVSFVAPFALMP